MSILQRYVLRELVGPIILSVLFFSFLMMLRQLFKFAELLLEAGVGFDILLEFLGIITLTLIIVTVPMAALLGTLIGIGRLTSENEILAMRVGGVSLPRIFLPVFVTAILGSVGLLWLGLDFMPGMIKRLVDKENRIQFEILTNLDEGRLYELETEGADVSLFYESRAAREKGDGPFTLRMKQIALRLEGNAEDIVGAEVASDKPIERDPATGIERRQQNETLVFAESGKILGNLEERTVQLVLDNGIVFPISMMETKNLDGQKSYSRQDTERETSITFKQLDRTLKPQENDDTPDKVDPRQLSLAQLRTLIANEPAEPFIQGQRRMSKEWELFLSARNEFYQRLTLPWSLLAFVLIAVPLAVELRPRAKSFAFIMSLGLIMLYYVMLTAASAVGMAYSPFTSLAYMAPNLIIGGIGLFLFWKVQR